MSEYKAFSALQDSLDKTREMLFTRFNKFFWLKLALIVFLMGLSLGGGNSRFGGDSTDFGIGQSPHVIYIILAIILFFIVLALFFSYISSVFKFVFIVAVSKQRVEIRNWFRQNMECGLSLFLFNFVVAIVFFILFVLTFALLIVPGILIESKYLLIAGGIFTVIVSLFLILCSIVISVFTYDFAIPLMYSKKIGIIQAWRQVIKIFRGNIFEFLVYLVLKIAMALVAILIELIVGIIFFAIFFVIGIILGLVGAAVGLGLWSLVKVYTVLLPVLWLGIVAAVLTFILFSWIFSYITIVLTLPFPVFFRLYSIFFIQSLDPKVKLVEKTSSKKVKGEKEGVLEKTGDDNLKVY